MHWITLHIITLLLVLTISQPGSVPSAVKAGRGTAGNRS
jgi:hypothetical protein